MYSCVRWCLVAAAVFSTQVAGLDDRSQIPRISVASGAGPPKNDVIGGSASAVAQTQSASHATSNAAHVSKTADQRVIPNPGDNNAGTIHTDKPNTNGQKAGPGFSIKEVTKPQVDSPQNSALQEPRETQGDPHVPAPPCEQPASADKILNEETVNKQVQGFSITEVTKPKVESSTQPPQPQDGIVPPASPVSPSPADERAESTNNNENEKKDVPEFSVKEVIPQTQNGSPTASNIHDSPKEQAEAADKSGQKVGPGSTVTEATKPRVDSPQHTRMHEPHDTPSSPPSEQAESTNKTPKEKTENKQVQGFSITEVTTSKVESSSQTPQTPSQGRLVPPASPDSPSPADNREESKNNNEDENKDVPGFSVKKITPQSQNGSPTGSNINDSSKEQKEAGNKDGNPHSDTKLKTDSITPETATRVETDRNQNPNKNENGVLQIDVSVTKPAEPVAEPVSPPHGETSPGTAQADTSGGNEGNKPKDNAKDAPQPIVSVTDMIKPVAASSPPDEPRTDHSIPTATDNGGASSKEDKGVVPKINALVTKLIKPVDGIPVPSPADKEAQTATTEPNAGANQPSGSDIKDTKDSVPPVETTGPKSETDSGAGSGTVKETKEAPKITEIIKPVAAVTDDRGTSKVEPDQSKGSLSTDVKQTEVVPQINESVTKMIKPVAESPEAKIHTEKAQETPSEMEKNAGDDSANKEPGEIKGEKTATSSKSSEETAHQTLSSSVAASSIEGEKGETKQATGPGSPSDSLTTVITPVQAIDSEKKETSSDHTKVAPAEVDKMKTATDSKHNDYTITPNEFAKKTADVHAQKLEEENQKSEDMKVDNNPSPVHDKNVPSMILPETGSQEPSEQGQKNKNESKTASQSHTDQQMQIKNGNKSQTQSEKHSEENKEGKPLKSSDHMENLNEMEFLELTKTLKKEVEEYDKQFTELANGWNDRKKKISFLGEATEVLDTYHTKITSYQSILEASANSKCSSLNLEKYDEKLQKINGIINHCESELKEISLNELQKKILNVKEQISEAEKDYDKISQLSKGGEHDNERKKIEHDAKDRLMKINYDEIRSVISDLKVKGLREIEDKYKICVDKEEKNIDDIVKETRLAIMDIFKCV